MNDLQIKTLKENILKYGQLQEISNLQELIFQSTEEDLQCLVKNFLNSSTFLRIWDYLLKAFQDSPNCHKKRINIILSVLNELEEREIFSSNVVQRLCMDLIQFKTENLVDICNFCLSSIQSNKPTSTFSFSWKDLLPDTLRILSEKDTVEFNGLDYSGQEFKTTFINTLCMSNWSAGKITQITAMFSDMPLNKEEHLKVVNKLSCYLDKLTPQEVPPFIYQLLRLCRHQNCRAVFLRLKYYFDLRIYSNNQVRKDNSSTQDDAIEIAMDQDVLEAESMVLFHIQSAASIGHNCIKDYLNSLKNTVKSADFILHPYQLLTLFTISTVAQYEDIVFEIIRYSIVRSYSEQQKQISSYWYRDIIPMSVKPEEIFKQIINLDNKEFLLEAFVNFGFALLNVGSSLGKDVVAEKQWILGTMILLKIIKRKRNIGSIVFKTFCTNILTKPNPTQYIKCLHYLSKSSSLLMIDNQSCIAELMESLMQISGKVANKLIEALMPLTKVSPIVRDQLILILRKCLYSRSIETRQVAVYGYVKLISTLRISDGGVLSQNSSWSLSSGYSLYTQISLNRSTQSASSSRSSSQAICFEILGILKRCFIQQVEVKLGLYEDIYNAVCDNPELGIPVLDVLWFHFMEYYVMDVEVNPPLNIDNLAILEDINCILQEPLGKLIFTISQIVAKVSQTENGSQTPTIGAIINVLDSLCSRMINCDLVHFGLDDGTDLTDPAPESQQKVLVLKEVINVFEALMGYKIKTLCADKENQCGIINSLLQGYLRFFNFGKNVTKPKKIKKNNQKNVMSQLPTQANTTKKTDNGVNMSLKVFKVPQSLLDLALVDKGLKTLLESSVPWASTKDANIIRTKIALHRHLVQTAIFLIGKIKTDKSVDEGYHRNHFNSITSIAETLYNRVIKRLGDYIDFDCTAAILCIECFHAIIILISGQFQKYLKDFLSKVVQKDEDSPLIEFLNPILQEFQKLFETEEDDLSNDIEIKKLPLAVMNNITALCNLVPSNSNVLSERVYEWLKQIAYHNTIPNKVAGNFMNLFCEIHIRYKPGLVLFEHASNSFFDIFGTINDDNDKVEESNETLKIINVDTANTMIQSVCFFNKHILDDADSIIAQIKSDYYIITYPGEDKDTKRKDNLKAKEKCVTCQLCFVAKILTNLMTLALPPGNLPDTVFKNVVQFYSSLSSLTKYLIGRSNKHNQAFQAVWFDKLVKLAGKKLASAIYRFIFHLENGQHKEDEAGVKKGQGTLLKSKILKETKTIPKVIFEMEQFSKYIIQLSKKTGHDLSKYVGQGTSRDFRINVKNLDGDLRRDNAEHLTQTQKDKETSRETIMSDNDLDNTEKDNDKDSPTLPPPTKKLKK